MLLLLIEFFFFFVMSIQISINNSNDRYEQNEPEKIKIPSSSISLLLFVTIHVEILIKNFKRISTFKSIVTSNWGNAYLITSYQFIHPFARSKDEINTTKLCSFCSTWLLYEHCKWQNMFSSYEWNKNEKSNKLIWSNFDRSVTINCSGVIHDFPEIPWFYFAKQNWLRIRLMRHKSILHTDVYTNHSHVELKQAHNHKRPNHTYTTSKY